MAHETQPRVLIVADDLTGALDTAGPFAQEGFATVVVAQPLDSDADAVSDACIVSINTDSRHLAADAAADRVERCVRQFDRQNFDIIFKKIDSTLRGNVVVETMALMAACDRTQALIAPAFPGQGRTVKNGVVHVEGVPLSRTGFAKDALSPPPLKPIGELFSERVGIEQVGSWQHGEFLSFPGKRVVVCDAGSEEDMSELFSKATGTAFQTLLVGSAGLGLTLAQHLPATTFAPQTHALSVAEFRDPVKVKPIVFVVGSRAVQSREQVDELRGSKNSVVLEAPNGALAEIPDLNAAMQIVLLAVPGPVGEDADSVVVATRLARAGLAIAGEVGAGAIVVTGGDTAIAVLEASKCAMIEVAGNLMPGIPYARFQYDGRPILLVTKAGGFGTRRTMADIVSRLRSDVASDP